MAHDKHEFETEVSCLAWEQNGTALAGDMPGAVWQWFGDRSIVAKDGKCKAGKLDRLGRPLGKGRGMGVADLCIPCEVVPGAITEWVPVAVKGCRKSGYGNRDLTLHAGPVIAHAEEGRALWVFLVRNMAGTFVMRRIDASKVIREAPDCWKLREMKSSYTRKDGSVSSYSYLRLRIEWSWVNKNHPHLFADSDWVRFDASIPGWPY